MNVRSIVLVNLVLINDALFASVASESLDMDTKSIGKLPALARFPRMYKGENVTWKNYPFIAQLMIQQIHLSPVNDFEFHCTGAMVTRQIMVTSAHCLRDWDGAIEHIQVRLETELSKGPKGQSSNWRVSGVFRHPGYTDRREIVDLALISIDVRINDDQPLSPLTLPEPNEEDNHIDGDYYYFQTLAYGAAFDKDPGYSLKHSKIRLYKDRCNVEWMMQIDPTHQLCARAMEFRYCVGDLGAPLFMERSTETGSKGLVLVGLVSEILYICSKTEYHKNDEIIISRISSDMPWILAKIDKYTQNHGMQDLMTKWQNFSYPDEVKNDDSMDITGNPADYYPKNRRSWR